jgi:hypothetical protein
MLVVLPYRRLGDEVNSQVITMRWLGEPLTPTGMQVALFSIATELLWVHFD